MINEDIVISIIVPIFNVEKYLKKCIESIMNQSHKKLEIILVDDGSTDGSGLICDNYKKLDSRIVVIHKQNGGLVSARKAGLDVSNGDYIGFVDGDDYIDENMYECLLDNMLKEKADIVHSSYFSNKNGKEKKIKGYNRSIIKNKNDYSVLLDNIFLAQNYIAPSMCTKLFKKNIVKDCYKNINNDLSYGEDLICFITMITKRYRIMVIEEAFYHYIEREGSIAHNKKGDTLKKEFNLCEAVKRVLCENNYWEEKQYLYNNFLKNHMITAMEKDSKSEFVVQKYLFPKPEILENKKIVIFGAGLVGRNYYSQISRYSNCSIVAWVDSRPENYEYKYINVDNVSVLLDKEYDIIIIGVLNKAMSDEITGMLRRLGISEKKIIWEIPENNFM